MFKIGPPRGRGRPRKFATDDPNARKRASRAAQKTKQWEDWAEILRQEEVNRVHAQYLDELATLLKQQKIDDENVSSGSLKLGGAERSGVARITTGGFNNAKIDAVDAARVGGGVSDEDFEVGGGGSGHRVTAEGVGGHDADINGDDAPSSGTWNKPRGEEPSQKTNRRHGYILCIMADGSHSVVDGPCQNFRVEVISNGRGRFKTRHIVPGVEATWSGNEWLLPMPAVRVRGGWNLACGCFREKPSKIIVTAPTEPVREEEDVEVDENTALAEQLRRKWKSEVH